MHRVVHISAFILIGVLIFFFYYSQRKVPIRIWDEAIYANNAIEMSRSHNYFILTNNGASSYYNTKPPMVIWFESIAINLFGINEFAIRFPSILALIGTAIGLIYFLRKNRQPIRTQLAAVLILFTSSGYMAPHVAATGDLDAMLTMWTTFLALAIFDLVLNSDRNLAKRIWIAGTFFLCAFFTKSTAALLVVPGLFLTILSFGYFGKIVHSKQFFFVSILYVSLIAVYYVAVSKTVPGYFKNVWHSEVERFYSNIMPWHNHPWYFYFQNLRERFWFWVFLIIPSLLFPAITKDSFRKKLFLAAAMYCLSFLLVITIPPVKLEFYDAPVYPILSLLMGLVLSEAYTFIKRKTRNIFSYAFLLFLIGLYSILFARIVKMNAHPMLLPQEVEGSFVKEVFKNLKPYNSKVLMTVEHPEHYDQLHFYRKKYAYQFKSNITIVASVKNLLVNDTVFVCQPQNKDSVLQLYEVDTLRSEGNCWLLKIVNRKSPAKQDFNYKEF